MLESHNNDRHIHNILFKESSKKVEYLDTQETQKQLLQEYSSHIDQIIKTSMAKQIGGSHLKNSGWNTDWQEVNPGQRIEQIKKEIEEKFSHYFYSIINNRQNVFKAGIEISDTQRENTDDPPASIYFRYKYIRTIVPKNDVQAKQKSEKSLDVLEKILPGFKEFQDDIQRLNIPLNPFYHISSFSKNDGRVTPPNLQSFITNERARLSNKPLQLPDGTVVSSNMYAEHERRIKSGKKVKLTDYVDTIRKFSNSEVGQLRDHGSLMRAIAEKVRDGYSLNLRSLQDTIKKDLQRKLDMHKLQRNSTDKKTQEYIANYDAYYFELYKRIKKSFDQGCILSSIEGSNPEFTWGGESDSGKVKQGLPAEKEKRAYVCPTLTSNDLRLLLTNLTILSDPSGQPEVGPDEFIVKGFKTVYQSNGWDSSPHDATENMLTLPPLRQLPSGSVVYDRDNGNFGQNHLVLNWKTGLYPLLMKWGKKCNEWLRTLQNIQNTNIGSDDVVSAIRNIISLSTGNRTGADGILDLLRKFETWPSFYMHHVQKSLSSELRTVNGFLQFPSKTKSKFLPSKQSTQSPRDFYDRIRQISYELISLPPDEASQEIDAISSDIVSKYMKGSLGWDAATLCLHEINKASKINKKITGNGISGFTKKDQDTCINQEGFDLLKQYGYQTAKIMDFLYGVMTRCCHEVSTTRTTGVVENFYGHQYSTSSGKGSGGEVMLSVRYAYFAPEITNDPQITKMIRDEQRKRHVRAGDILQRSTQHYQRAEPTGRFTDPKDVSTEVGILKNIPGMSEDTSIKIVENIEYFIGQSGSSGGMHKTLHSGLPWPQMIDLFTETYPDLALQLGVVFEPMNANLQRLELSCKRAIDKVRQNLPVVYVNSKGETTVLSDTSIKEQAMSSVEDSASETTTSQQQIAESPQQSAPNAGQVSYETKPQATEQVVPVSPAEWSHQFPQNQPVMNTHDTSVPVAPLPDEQASIPSSNIPQQNNTSAPRGRISKDKKKKSLFRKPKSASAMNFIDMLVKTADRLDECGYTDVSDKINIAIQHMDKIIDV